MLRAFGTLLLLITITCARSTQNRVPKDISSYCVEREEAFSTVFNFTSLSSLENDYTIKDEKSGDTIKLQLCKPLNQTCNGMEGYRICLIKNGKEIGIGKQAPRPPDTRSGQLVFSFEGEECRENEKYSMHINMKCKNENVNRTLPQIRPDQSEHCSYHLLWETKEACGPEKIVNCSAVGSTNEHYDLSPLMFRSDNYKIPISPRSTIILNVCHSVVFDRDVVCHPSVGACLRETDETQKVSYKGLGDVQESPKFDNDTKDLVLTYNNGGICEFKGNDVPFHVQTSISFSCDYHATNTVPEYLGGHEQCHHKFRWKTVAACSVESLKNRSIVTAGTCKVTNPLTNMEYNLKDLMNKAYHSTTPNGTEYVFRVCGSLLDGSCPVGSGACDTRNNVSTGLANANLTWSQGGPYLNYTNGAECGKNQRYYTFIAFFCGSEQSANTPVIMEHENCSLVIHWNTPLVCEKPVRCETRNGEISLESLIQSTENYVVKANDTEFHISVCRPLVPKPYLTCEHGSAACRVIPQANGQFSNETSLGYPEMKPFFDDKKNVILKYTEGSTCPEDNRLKLSSNLTFSCNYSAATGAPKYKHYESCTHVFEWVTSIVCATAEGQWEKNCTIVNPHLSHKIDLSPLRQKSVINVKNQVGVEYQISICGGDAHCKGSTVCKNDMGYGTSSLVIFDYNKKVIKLQFTNGSKCTTGFRSSEVHFICNESSGIGEPIITWEEECSVTFEWRTSVVCVNYRVEEKKIDEVPKTEKTTENIEETVKGNIGPTLGIALTVVIAVLSVIYLWNPERRARLKSCVNCFSSRRDNCRAQYTKVDATEEAQLLLDVGETTRCVTDSDSDDELLNA